MPVPAGPTRLRYNKPIKCEGGCLNPCALGRDDLRLWLVWIIKDFVRLRPRLACVSVVRPMSNQGRSTSARAGTGAAPLAAPDREAGPGRGSSQPGSAGGQPARTLRPQVRLVVASALAAGAVALIVLVDMFVSSAAVRIAALACAALLVVTVVAILPAGWRRRLGPLAAAFVTASGALSGFLIAPSDSADTGPVVDAQQMATAVQFGPFDQRLPTGFTAGLPTQTHIGDPSSASKIVAVQVPIRVPRSIGGGVSVFAELEVYPSVKAAQARATAQKRFLSDHYMTPTTKQTIAGFCVLRDPEAWTCGGTRGHTYAETTLAPAPNAFLGFTQDITSALLNYAWNKEKLASH